jgi:integrase
MKTKCKVNFYLEKRINKKTGKLITENVPIIMFFSFDGKRLQYYIGHRIDEDQWDENEQKVKRNNFNRDEVSATIINDHIIDIQKCVNDIYLGSKALRQTPTVQYIREELKKAVGDQVQKPLSFFDIFAKFIETESQVRTWTKGTLTKFSTNISHLKTFQEKKRFKIEFDSIDEAFFNKYVKYMREDLEHRNTTIAKNLKIFKWFMNWATKKGYNKNLAFRDYDPDLKGTTRSQKIIFLTWDELMGLYSKKVPKKYLAQVRDVFCFCCFTGLRYSDVYNLKRGNIKSDTIEITTIKTDDMLIIDLNDYAKAILNKYKDVQFKDDKCLPVISNQKMNVYLKELGEFAKLNQPETVIYYIGNERKEDTFKKWELLSTHTGRKTFISNALFFNIPSEVIMSWTGHKDHKVMENYYKIIAPQKRREMDKMNIVKK